jgi:hypothetical protein
MIIGELKELDAKYEQYLQNTISNDDIKNATINNILMTFSTNGIMILFNSDFARELNRLIGPLFDVRLGKSFSAMSVSISELDKNDNVNTTFIRLNQKGDMYVVGGKRFSKCFEICDLISKTLGGEITGYKISMVHSSIHHINEIDIPKMFKQMNIPSSPIEVSPACKNNLNQYFNTAKIALKNSRIWVMVFNSGKLIFYNVKTIDQLEILTKLTVDLLKNFLKPKDVLDVDVEINPPVKRGRKSASYKERNIGYSF